MNLQFFTSFITIIGLIMPFLILQFNKGYKSANRFLAGYLFFASLYLMGNFFIFYGQSEAWIIFFILLHPFFFLIGPLSFIYVRSIVKDNYKFTKNDFFHFLPFFLSLIGLIPFLFRSWEYKLSVAINIKSDTWDTSKFLINYIFPTKIDQGLSLFQTIFYAVFNWILIGKNYSKMRNNIQNVAQYQLIKKWLYTFSSIYCLVAVDYLLVMFCIWLYPLKSVFLLKANFFLLIASIIYFLVNMSILFYPQIMYGLPIEYFSKKIEPPLVDEIQSNNDLLIEEPLVDDVNIENGETLLLFSEEYINFINKILNGYLKDQSYLSENFKLSLISSESGIPIHHLTYYFNFILKTSFSDWRNKLRIDYAIFLFNQDVHKQMNLNGIAEKCGFSIPSTFIRSFKKYTDKTPSEYLKSLS